MRVTPGECLSLFRITHVNLFLCFVAELLEHDGNVGALIFDSHFREFLFFLLNNDQSLLFVKLAIDAKKPLVCLADGLKSVQFLLFVLKGASIKYVCEEAATVCRSTSSSSLGVTI